MTWQDLLEHCLAKPGAWQDEPWEGDVVVKVGPKIFAFLGVRARGHDRPEVRPDQGSRPMNGCCAIRGTPR